MSAPLDVDAVLAAAPAAPSATAPAPREPALSASPDANFAQAAAIAGVAFPPKGARLTARLAIIGGFAYAKKTQDEAVAFVREMYRSVPDEPDELDLEKLASEVRDTFKRHAEGVHVTGFPTLAGMVGSDVVAAVQKRLDGTLGMDARLAEVRASASTLVGRLTPAQRAKRMVGRDVTRLRTGLSSLDAATRGGILLRKLVVIGGAPGAGKTALLVRLAYTWLTQGVRVGILASDEDADGLLTRLGQLHGLSRDALERGDPGACSALEAWCESVPLLLADGDEDGGSIEALSRELRVLANGRPSGMLVDSIQTARSEVQVPTGTDARAKVDAIVRALKHSAKVDGHLVAASSELSRAAYRNKDAAENANALAAFKESGGIEYGVSLAVVLSSRQGTSELVDAAVVKNRLGPGKPEFMLRLDHDRADVRETTAQDARAADPLYSVKADLKAALEVACGGPLSKSGLAGKVGGRKQLALRAIGQMLDANQLHEETRGIRFPLPGEPGFDARCARN